MPIRIYDISQKLGLENKQVLAKARELGISAARVASSSMDKITADYLEEQLRRDYPAKVSSSQASQPTPTTGQNDQPPTPRPVVIKAVSSEIHNLVERILSGQVPFLLEISREDGSPPLRATLVAEGASVPSAQSPKPDPQPRAELDERTKDLFRAAYFSARHVSKDDWVNLAEYGSALKRQDPTFQPQDFGERSLGGLVRRMLNDFEIKSDENAPPVYYIRLKPQNIGPRPQPQPTAASLPPSQPTHTARGKVHNLKLGFGFIAPDDGSANIFFHATEVVGCTIFDLRPGDPVEYEAGLNERGPCAWKVRRVASASV